MYITVNKKKIKLKEAIGFKERYKSLKFYFKTLDFALKFSNVRFFNTYFFVQNVDICLTNKNNIIVKLYENVPTERFFLPKKNGRNLYFLPLGTCKNLEVGDVLFNYK